jgi:acyl carrier protein
MYRRLRTLIAETLGVEESEVVPEASFEDDLNADHQEILDLMIAIEEEFGIKIDDAVTADLQTVGDLVEYLEDKVG